MQGALVETWEYTEDDFVFAFGEAVIAAVQRPETHIGINSGASRSACPIGYAPDVSAKGTAPPLFSIDGSRIEQRGYKKMQWKKRDFRQPMPLPSQSQGVSHVKLQKRNGTYCLWSDRRVTVDDMSSANALAGFFPSQIAPMQEGGATSSTDVAEPFPDATEVGKTSKESVSAEQGQQLRASEPDQ